MGNPDGITKFSKLTELNMTIAAEPTVAKRISPMPAAMTEFLLCDPNGCLVFVGERTSK
jgi:hypothetical protein